jgi:UDP:flavonoid glycosyltransferase YjiC (YdhE family)
MKLASQRKKILFFGEGVTMTHFVRPAALAESLDPDEWEIFFWTPKRHHRLLRGQFSKLGNLRTIHPARFLNLLAHGKPLYDAETIRNYVRDDLEIIEQVRPDFIFGDFRLSLCISAPVAGVPFGSIFNAQWSSYWRQPAIVPELPLTRWVSPRILNPLFSLLRPEIYAYHAKPVNDVRLEYGLAPLSKDIRSVYTSGDLVLYPDVPEFVPIADAPDNHHFIGSCPWTSPTPKPAWWTKVMESSIPKIFVTLGSSGPVKALPAVLEAASHLPVKVILATSGRPIGKVSPNVYIAELLPYEETSRHCAAVVSQGGTGGLYFTLAAGTPTLAIPNNIDNHLSSALLNRSGAGLCVRVEDASVKTLRRALERLLFEKSFKQAAAKWPAIMGRYNTKEIFPDILRNWFTRAEESAPFSEVPQEVCV